MDKIGTAVTVGVLVWAFSSMLNAWAQTRVRSKEHKANESAAPPRRALAWHIVHVRDDVATLVIVGPNLTNALLAAILAVLVIG